MSAKIGFLRENLKRYFEHSFRKGFCTKPTYVYPSIKDEYTSTPQYPPIEKVDEESLKMKKEKQWMEKIKRQLTVEEKLLEVNVDRMFGWKCLMVHEGVVPFDNLKFAQHMTRSHLIEMEGLPDCYETFSDKISSLTNEIKNQVVDAIEYQLAVSHHKVSQLLEPEEREKEMTKIVIIELNRILSNCIWEKEPHLKSAQIDYTPRIESCWKINSMVETVIAKEQPKFGLPINELPEEYLDRPSDKFIQYIGQPILQVRHLQPLPSVIDLFEGNIFAYSVPVYEYDPHVCLGYELDRRHITNIPGFWPGDDREFSFMSYHCSCHLKNRPPPYGDVDKKEALYSQALFASFGWLKALSCYQGFSCYNDITYPFVTQTVLTDGKEFTFAVYQMNTTELYHKNAFNNPKCNICWISPTMALYETYEDGKLKGFNEQVLNNLLKFYLNKPKAIPNTKMKPYLGDKIQHIAHYEDDEKREWLENIIKKISSNKQTRKTPEFVYEVYDWERIYKIDHGLMPRSANKRPFELRQNPYHKKMTDTRGKYIPKMLRPDKDLPKWRQRKFQKTFFPE